jgi:hypothetical protein
MGWEGAWDGMGREVKGWEGMPEGRKTQTTGLLQLTLLPSFVFSQGKGKWD